MLRNFNQLSIKSWICWIWQNHCERISQNHFINWRKFIVKSLIDYLKLRKKYKKRIVLKIAANTKKIAWFLIIFYVELTFFFFLRTIGKKKRIKSYFKFLKRNRLLWVFILYRCWSIILWSKSIVIYINSPINLKMIKY